MNHKNNTKRIIAGYCFLLMLVSFTACSGQKGELSRYNGYEKVSLSASWAYNYGSVQELAKSCDLAAYVTIKDMKPDNRYSSYGITTTIYTAEISESIYGEQKGDIQIIMTGGIRDSEKKIYEVTDDPLMQINDEYFIFAKKNEDGTYTILSGSQGRFEIVDETVYSLNVCNDQVKKSNLDSNIKIDGQSKEEFYTQIKDIVK